MKSHANIKIEYYKLSCEDMKLIIEGKSTPSDIQDIGKKITNKETKISSLYKKSIEWEIHNETLHIKNTYIIKLFVEKRGLQHIQRS